MRPAVLLFVFGLCLGLPFWHATPDRDQAFAGCYQGDAPYWQLLAHADAEPPSVERPAELRIPLRPPGTHWLVSLLWDGAAPTAYRMRILFVVLGALVAPLLFLVLAQSFARRVALLAGGLTAAATNLMVVGSGVHGEIPYLLLFLLSMLDWQRLRAGKGPLVAGRWALLHALATLVRAEHLLVFAACLLLLWWPRAAGRWRTAGWALLAYFVALVPWHVTAWSAIDRFNTTAPPLPARGTLPWRPGAVQALEGLPAFLRQAAFGFVDATVRHRGGREVRTEDLAVLEEAYGPMPGPLGRPFVALYGPLNFFLANGPEADGGFSPEALDRPPRLSGGRQHYPPDWLANLPRGGTLALSYPLHVRYLNQGYRLGFEWIAANPGAAFELVGTRLRFFWQGAATGLGGWALPLGLSGERRRVDLVVAGGALAAWYRGLWLALGLTGLWVLRRQPTVRPWLAFAATKVVVAMVFFGYARQGALCIPAVALLAAAAMDRAVLARLPRVPWGRIGLGLIALLVLLEVARWIASPDIVLDGEVFGPPAVVDEGHAVRRVAYR